MGILGKKHQGQIFLHGSLKFCKGRVHSLFLGEDISLALSLGGKKDHLREGGASISGGPCQIGQGCWWHQKSLPTSSLMVELGGGGL